MNCIYLAWDSDFFKYKIAKIEIDGLSIDLIDQLNSLKSSDYTLIYLFSKKELNISNSDLVNFNPILVDKKITYEKKLSNVSSRYDKNIYRYNRDIIDNKLIELAVQSGEYSRFKIDNRIGYKKFRELYEIWIKNSVQKKPAKETLIYHLNDIKGFVIVGEKRNKAWIDLIAVDETTRGKGIGTKLIIAAESWAKSKGCTEMRVVTQQANLKACKFYEKHGYQLMKKEYVYHIWLKIKKNDSFQ